MWEQYVEFANVIDRGPDSGHVLKGLRLFQELYPQNVKILIGNHEQMMLDFFWNSDLMWKTYGGNESVSSFEQVFTDAELNDFLSWSDRLPIVFQTDKYVFTHAGINPDLPLNKQVREVLWINEKEFSTKVSVDSLQQITNGRIIVHGHTPGSVVFPDKYAALALVDLTNGCYYRYSFKNHKITVHKLNMDND